MGTGRFYRKAEAVEGEGGCYTVALDGRPVRTPARRTLALPTRALAEAIAPAWPRQGEKVRLDAMPIIGLPRPPNDRVETDRERVLCETLAQCGPALPYLHTPQ